MKDIVVSSICLAEKHIQELRALASRSLPNESCALLIGAGDREIFVTGVVPMQNADSSPTRFRIDPQDLFDAYHSAEKKRLQVVAVFHSHPASPTPSRTDKKFMELNPIVWIICSTHTFELKGYIFESGLREVPIRTLNC